MQVVDTFPRPVRVIENVWIPLSDGCQLAARAWLPEDAESKPVPGILEFIPYRKRDHTRLRDEPIHHYIARHGYAALRVDVRGSGDSDGFMAGEYQHREQFLRCASVLRIRMLTTMRRIASAALPRTKLRRNTELSRSALRMPMPVG